MGQIELFDTINDGLFAQITFLPNTGGTYNLGTQRIPYTFDTSQVGEYPYGTYFLNYFSKTCTVQIPTVNSSSFITEWSVSNLSGMAVSLPYLPSGTYSGTIYWGDGTNSPNSYNNRSHTYTNPGDYTVIINGAINPFTFNDTINQEFILKVIQWGDVRFGNTGRYFAGCTNLTLENVIDVPKFIGTSNLAGMFISCSSLSIINRSNFWNTSNITNMNGMFVKCIQFDSDISDWDVSSVTDMSGMFTNAESFNQNIGNWDVSSVTGMSDMFSGALSFDQNIGNWDVSSVTGMSGMFAGADSFNNNGSPSINSWDVSNVQDMSYMFSGDRSFNQPISDWVTSAVTNMRGMFNTANQFNQEIGNWDVSNVQDMSYMFNSAFSFNKNIGNWDVSSVTDMSYMFNLASLFNNGNSSSISGWTVSAVTNMVSMFREANDFSQDLSNWCVPSILSLPTNFYNNATSWFGLPGRGPQWGLCPSSNAESRFISLWEVPNTNYTITLPYIPNGTYNGYIYWGDGTRSINQYPSSHQYSNPGIYKIIIDSVVGWNFGYEPTSRDDIIEILQWGTNFRLSPEYLHGNYFQECVKLKLSGVTDILNLDGITSMELMFDNCDGLTSVNNMEFWSTSAITNMYGVFRNTRLFNHNISSWDVSQVQNMDYMFNDAKDFNQDLSPWCVQNIGSEPTSFKDGATHWELPKPFWGSCPFVTVWVTDADKGVFLPLYDGGSYNFTAYFNGDAKNITDYTDNKLSFSLANTIYTVTIVINGRFEGWNFELTPTSRDQILDVLKWGNVSLGNSPGHFLACRNLTLTGTTDILTLGSTNNLFSMFRGCSKLVGNSFMNSWNTTGVQNMGRMFRNAEKFNQNISSWDVSQVTDMEDMFRNAYAFNQNLSSWCVPSIYPKPTNFDLNATGWTGGVLTRPLWGNCVPYSPNYFISIWSTSLINPTIELPYSNSGTYTGTIYWGDGQTSANEYPAIHTYSQVGTYIIIVAGTIDGWRFNNEGYKKEIREILQWGTDFRLGTGGNYFYGCSNLILSGVTDILNLDGTSALTGMFRDCASITTVNNMNSWNVSGVSNMVGLFQDASSFDQNIGNWNVSGVTDMSDMFNNARQFNQNIGNWNVSSVLKMNNMFQLAEQFDQDIRNWNVSGVTEMDNMFKDAISFNRDLGNWCVPLITSLPNGFYSNTTSWVGLPARAPKWGPCFLNSTNTFISIWRITNAPQAIRLPYVTGGNYSGTIYWGDGTSSQNTLQNSSHTYNSNGDYMIVISGNCVGWNFSNLPTSRDNIIEIKKWGTGFILSPLGGSGHFSNCSNLTMSAVTDVLQISSEIQNLTNMFLNCTSLTTVNNMNLWDTRRVGDMRFMFQSANLFNQDIGNWDVGGVASMASMFEGASSFNQDIGNWDVSSVQDMKGMFKDASTFNQNIGNWNVSLVNNMDNMFDNAVSFNQDLGNWCVSLITSLPDNFYFGATAWENLPGTAPQWGTCYANTNNFVSLWESNGTDAIYLPYYEEGTYNGRIYWGNESSSQNQFDNRSYLFTTPGTYRVTISGQTSGFNFSVTPDPTPLFLKEILQWGTGLRLQNEQYNFSGCSNLKLNRVSDVPILTGQTTFRGLFKDCSGLTTINKMNLWDTSSIIKMGKMFENATQFNQNINYWNVSNVTEMGYMFFNVSGFNQNIKYWNVSKVTNMEYMFYGASEFNQDIGNWNVSGVTIMNSMFQNATNFNQNLSNWCVSQIPQPGPTDFDTGAINWTGGTATRPQWGKLC